MEGWGSVLQCKDFARNVLLHEHAMNEWRHHAASRTAMTGCHNKSNRLFSVSQRTVQLTEVRVLSLEVLGSLLHGDV